MGHPCRGVLMKPGPSAKRLREIIHYDPETGLFTWRVFRRGSAKAGSPAGKPTNKGRISFMLDGVFYLAHRLAWLYVHGTWPADQIDHIDGDPTNNRISNLREATQSQNQQNKHRPNRTNKSGCLGVQSRKNGKFVAEIQIEKRRVYLGIFENLDDADAAVIEARKTLHPYAPERHQS